MSIIDIVTPAQRKIVLIVADTLLSVASLFLAFLFHYSLSDTVEILGTYWGYPVLFVAVRIAIFSWQGLYTMLWRYASIDGLVKVIRAVTMSSVLLSVGLYVTRIYDFSLSILILDGVFNFMFVGSVRLGLRLYRERLIYNSQKRIKEADKINLLIIGAGDGGDAVAREILRVSSLKYRLIGFVDDKVVKVGTKIRNTPVLGTTQDILRLAEIHQIQEAIIAIPSATGPTIRRLVSLCEEANLRCTITPGLFEIINGKVEVSQLRQVRIEDLLGRQVVETDLSVVSDYVAGEVVLVTGAGGSIGAELCRQIIQFGPKTLVMLDHSESAMYDIDREIRNSVGPEVGVMSIVGDVKNRHRMDRLYTQYKPQIVFHAAAYKHVPLMEDNAVALVENNIRGTRNMVELAHQHRTKAFVLVSTDKAVNPENCMGASKRACELVMQIQAAKSDTVYSAVRFGNVLGSNGSVVPLFKEQISKGGPVTVTDPDMTRYFMTIPEAVRLVIEAGAISRGGEIFVLDMGQPVKIITLARDMIYLSGLEEGKDIKIEIIGKRPGEKTHERLVMDDESLSPTSRQKINLVKPVDFDYSELSQQIDQLLTDAVSAESDVVKEALMTLTQKTQSLCLSS